MSSLCDKFLIISKTMYKYTTWWYIYGNEILELASEYKNYILLFHYRFETSYYQLENSVFIKWHSHKILTDELRLKLYVKFLKSFEFRLHTYRRNWAEHSTKYYRIVQTHWGLCVNLIMHITNLFLFYSFI